METTWEITYYTTPNGACPVEKFITSRSPKKQAKLLALLACLEERGPELPQPYVEVLEDACYALHILISGKQIRTFYFFCEKSYLVLTHGVLKTTMRDRRFELKKLKTCRTHFLQQEQMSGEGIRTFQQHLSKTLQDESFTRLYEEDRQILEMAFRIIDARKQAGLTLNELAKKAHIKRNQLEKLEYGVNCTMLVYVKVCQALGLTELLSP